MNTSRTINVILAIYVVMIFAFVFAPIIFSIILSFNSRRFPTIPLIIMALAMLAWFSKIAMSGQVYTIVIAHSVLTAPFAVAVIRLRLNQIDPDLEPAAWNLGKS